MCTKLNYVFLLYPQMIPPRTDAAGVFFLLRFSEKEQSFQTNTFVSMQGQWQEDFSLLSVSAVSSSHYSAASHSETSLRRFFFSPGWQKSAQAKPMDRESGRNPCQGLGWTTKLVFTQPYGIAPGVLGWLCGSLSGPELHYFSVIMWTICFD